MSIIKVRKKKYILTPPSFEVPVLFYLFVSVGLMFFPSKEIMDYCKIKNKPIFYYEAEKKRQKIDFRFFFFCHHFKVLWHFLLLFFSLAKSPQTRMESKRPVDTFHFFVPFFYVLFWTAVTHFTWTLWRWDKVSLWRLRADSLRVEDSPPTSLQCTTQTQTHTIIAAPIHSHTQTHNLATKCTHMISSSMHTQSSDSHYKPCVFIVSKILSHYLYSV